MRKCIRCGVCAGGCPSDAISLALLMSRSWSRWRA
ncbi:4Fe-4S binding protein [Chloroflexota bacterium]